MYGKIIDFVQSNGPALPAEVAGKLNLNSFLAKAFLEDLVEQGKLIRGDRVGSTNIFYLAGQEDAAKKLASEANNPSRTVGGHVGKNLDMSPDAVAKREKFKKHFSKTLSEPKQKIKKPTLAQKPTTSAQTQTKSWTHQNRETTPPSWASSKEISSKLKTQPTVVVKPIAPTISVPREPKTSPTPALKKRITNLFTAKPRPTPVSKKKKTTKATSGAYLANIKNMFYSGQSKVIEEISEKKKKGKYVVDFPSSIGAVRHLVTVLDKKTINKSDIALAYTASANKKLPALLITNGKLANTAKDYAEELGGMFRWKVVK